MTPERSDVIQADAIREIGLEEDVAEVVGERLHLSDHVIADLAVAASEGEYRELLMTEIVQMCACNFVFSLYGRLAHIRNVSIK